MAKHGNISSRFFKVIVPQTEENGALEFPTNFVKEHGEHLSRHATLKVPTGAVSRIEVERRDGRAWLHKGWPDFVEKYSIKLGFFLVFKYKGQSCFDVLIFDYTTSETEYPRTSRNRKPIQVKEEDCEDDCPNKVQMSRKRGRKNQSGKVRIGQQCSSEITSKMARKRKTVVEEEDCEDDCPNKVQISWKRGRKNQSSKKIFDYTTSEIEYPRTSPNRKPIQIKEDDCEDDCPNKVQICRKRGRKNQSSKVRIGQQCSSEINSKMARKRKAVEEEDCEDGDEDDRTNQSIGATTAVERVIARANTFRSSNPHFIINMSKSHIFGHIMSIPADHGRSYFLEKKSTSMSVKGVDGIAWPMKYIIGPPPENRVRICSGWWDFIQKNRLEVGDACVFELVDGRAMEFKLTVFHIADELHQADRNDTRTLKRGRGRVASIKRPGSFVINISPSYLKRHANVNIPKAHVERYLKGGKCGENVVIFHGSRGKTWPVKCQFSSENAAKSRASFVRGWEDFALDNNLRVGDSCTFEMITEKAKEYKVSVTHGAA